MTLPSPAGFTVPWSERTAWIAVTSLDSTDGSAAGMLCAPSTSFKFGTSAASRFTEFT